MTLNEWHSLRYKNARVRMQNPLNSPNLQLHVSPVYGREKIYRQPQASSRVGGGPWATLDHMPKEDIRKVTFRCVVIALIAGLVGGSRWLYETSFIHSMLNANGAVWQASYSTIVSWATGLSVFLLCFAALRFFA